MSGSFTVDAHRVWLAQVNEPVVDPERPIVDAHHHLWRGYGVPVPWQPDYWIDDFASDLDSGHRIIATVYVECGYGYRQGGNPALAPAGEIETLDGFARDFEARHGTAHRPCAAIVGHADLRLGASVAATLEALITASPLRLRGVRQITNWDPHEEVRYKGFFIAPGVMLDPTFREGFAQLARFGLSFDAWQFHPQLPELLALARAFPHTQLIIDHFGGPVGIGPYASHRSEVFEQWQRLMREFAALPNTIMKLGGLNMEHGGLGWHHRPRPPSSDELVVACEDYILAAIDMFGPDRCMFESNFPVDKVSCSYNVLWNAFKKIAARFTPDERTALFSGTAQRVYRIGD
jgi:L-fuconolactonase